MPNIKQPAMQSVGMSSFAEMHMSHNGEKHNQNRIEFLFHFKTSYFSSDLVIFIWLQFLITFRTYDQNNIQLELLTRKTFLQVPIYETIQYFNWNGLE